MPKIADISLSHSVYRDSFIGVAEEVAVHRINGSKTPNWQLVSSKSLLVQKAARQTYEQLHQGMANVQARRRISTYVY